MSDINPLVLMDQDGGYADEWVWVEVTDQTATEQDAREWADGTFLNANNEEAVPVGPITRVWMESHACLDGDEGEFLTWTQAAPHEEGAREFWEIDVSEEP
jgi:hypothetical protein